MTKGPFNPFFSTFCRKSIKTIGEKKTAPLRLCRIGNTLGVRSLRSSLDFFHLTRTVFLPKPLKFTEIHLGIIEKIPKIKKQNNFQK
jgi:hypothetical protein